MRTEEDRRGRFLVKGGSKGELSQVQFCKFTMSSAISSDHFRHLSLYAACIVKAPTAANRVNRDPLQIYLSSSHPRKRSVERVESEESNRFSCSCKNITDINYLHCSDFYSKVLEIDVMNGCSMCYGLLIAWCVAFDFRYLVKSMHGV
jgi:hypothetical protein